MHETRNRPLVQGEPGTRADYRIAEILQRPLWSVEDIAILMSLPLSTTRELIGKTPIEGGFLAGRQIRYQPADVHAWFATLQKERPYTPRQNNPRKAA